MHRLLTTSFALYCITSLFMSHPAYAGRENNDSPPPFSIAGTVINPPGKSVLIEPKANWNGQEESKRKSLWFREGDYVQGFRVVKIDKDQVTFARSGKTYRMAVGYGHFLAVTSGKTPETITVNERGTFLSPLIRIEPTVPFDQDKTIKAKFIPPPKNLSAIRIKARAFLKQLRMSPSFTQKNEEVRARFYRRIEKRKAHIYLSPDPKAQT